MKTEWVLIVESECKPTAEIISKCLEGWYPKNMVIFNKEILVDIERSEVR